METDTFENPKIETEEDFNFWMREHSFYCGLPMDIEQEDGIETARCYDCRFATARRINHDKMRGGDSHSC